MEIIKKIKMKLRVWNYSGKYKVEKICYLCKQYGLNNKKNLTIHHIDHDPGNNNYQNIIILCSDCHAMVHDIEMENIKKYERLIDLNEKYK